MCVYWISSSGFVYFSSQLMVLWKSNLVCVLCVSETYQSQHWKSHVRLPTLYNSSYVDPSLSWIVWGISTTEKSIHIAIVYLQLIVRGTPCNRQDLWPGFSLGLSLLPRLEMLLTVFCAMCLSMIMHQQIREQIDDIGCLPHCQPVNIQNTGCGARLIMLITNALY